MEYQELKDTEQDLIIENLGTIKLLIPIAILGESGSGKSYIFHKILQSLNKKTKKFDSNIYEPTYGY